MHPAPSVIIFTSLSGLGFGLLVFLGLAQPAPLGWQAFGMFVLAYGLAVGGLIASTRHLGRPERALKAFAQWKTSWLSREGWCAVLTLLVMAAYGAGLVFWHIQLTVLGVLGAVLSACTVLTTSMIYAQLKTVPRWHSPLTPVLFLSLALAGGALLMGYALWSVVLLLGAGAVQWAYWVQGDGAFARSQTDLASATGLTASGGIRAFEPPHTGTNYLLREFVYVVGRKHAAKLRIVASFLMVVLPVLVLLLIATPLGLGVAAVSHLAGVMISRWLFFAEAEHVVGLYYGKR